MSHTLFISDLHLCVEAENTTQYFHRFIKDIAPQAEALYILGDLFEYWVGDDDVTTPFHHEITQALYQLTQQGVALHIMRGNRDFLMSQQLVKICNATLLEDPILLDLYGQPTLLTHGDALCTDDVPYQEFRQMVRSAAWQDHFLSQPLFERKAQIEKVRRQSTEAKRMKAENIMDVNLNAVHHLLETYHYPRIIHGHTHRPAHHLHHVNGHTCDRWVLGDWDKQANALRCSANGIALERIPSN